MNNNIYGRGIPILKLHTANEFIKKLNKEYPDFYHSIGYDSTNELYFIEWISKNPNNNIIIIKI